MCYKVLLVVAVAAVACEAGLIHHEEVSDWKAYPKYDFKYGVEDHKTGDWKERSESRDGDVVKQQYSWGEHDREVKVSKIDHSHEVKIPVVHHHVPVVHHHTVPVITHHEVPVVHHHTVPVITHHKVPVVHHQVVPVVTHHKVPVISHHEVPVVSHQEVSLHGDMHSW